MIRKLLVLFVALSSHAALASDPLDLILTDSGVTITVRGTGEFVCSGQNEMKDRIPYLGRGLTQMEAQANVMNLLASKFGGSIFNKIIRCERSITGRGRISMSSTSGSWRIIVEGPAQHQCITEHEMKRVFFVANAGTLTEAEALSMGACCSPQN